MAAQDGHTGSASEVMNKLTVKGTAKIGDATTDTISFYGVTPVAQQSGAGQTAVSTSTLTTVSQSAPVKVSVDPNAVFGFNQTQAEALVTLASETKTRLSATVTLVNQLRSDLLDLGLIAGS